MYTPQIYSGTNVHANMPYCETRMKGLPTSIGVMCIHLPTTPFIYHPIHLPLAWRARLLGEGRDHYRSVATTWHTLLIQGRVPCGLVGTPPGSRVAPG